MRRQRDDGDAEGGGAFTVARGFGRDRVREELERENERGGRDGVWGRRARGYVFMDVVHSRAFGLIGSCPCCPIVPPRRPKHITRGSDCAGTGPPTVSCPVPIWLTRHY